MAIKALRLRLQIKEARAALEAAQAAAKAREERENALAEAIEQAETAEDRAAVEAEFQALESDDTQGELGDPGPAPCRAGGRTPAGGSVAERRACAHQQHPGRAGGKEQKHARNCPRGYAPQPVRRHAH